MLSSNEPMTRICTRCGIEKDLADFSFRDSHAGKRQRVCKTCHRVQSRAHYANNKSAYMARSREQNRRIKLENREKLLAYLRDKQCVDCGERDPIVLEFDHVRDKKRTEVATLLRRHTTWSTILAEIAKCEIRCGNCHRRKTAKERGWFRAR